MPAAAALVDGPRVVTIDVTTSQIAVIGEGREPAYSPDGTLIAIQECFSVAVIDAAKHAERCGVVARWDSGGVDRHRSMRRLLRRRPARNTGRAVRRSG